MDFHEEAFAAAAQITAAIAEEADIKLNAEGAEKTAEFFAVLYKKLAAVARGEQTVEKPKIRVKVNCEQAEEQPALQTAQEDEEAQPEISSWASEEEVYE